MVTAALANLGHAWSALGEHETPRLTIRDRAVVVESRARRETLALDECRGPLGDALRGHEGRRTLADVAASWPSAHPWALGLSADPAFTWRGEDAIELARRGLRVRVTIAPRGAGIALPGGVLRYEVLKGEEPLATHAAALVALLAHTRGETAGALDVPSAPSLSTPAPSTLAEDERIERALRGAPEALGAPITRERWGPGFRLRFPPAPPERLSPYLRVPDSISARPVLRGAITALGYEVDPTGHLSVVPSPRTYLALRAGDADGFVPNLVEVGSPIMPMQEWLSAYLAGRVDINIGSPGFRVALGPLRGAGALTDFWTEHYASIGHDMSTHVWPTHRAPPDLLAALADEVRGALADKKRRHSLRPLVAIYEEDLVSACLRAWERCPEPDDFTEVARAEWPLLLERARERARDKRFAPLERVLGRIPHLTLPGRRRRPGSGD